MDASSQYVWNIKFINEIEKRPGIWNQSITSRDLQKRLWEELSELYSNKSVDSLKRKYNNLKGKFRQQLSFIPQTNDQYDIDPRSFESDWPHFQQMLFLLNDSEMKKKEKRKSVSSEQDHIAKKKRDENENMKSISPGENRIAEKKRGEGIATNMHNTFGESMLKEGTSTEIIVKPDIYPCPPTDDGLYHFLMGLYDSMNELDPIRKVNVQARIYVMLSEELSATVRRQKEVRFEH